MDDVSFFAVSVVVCKGLKYKCWVVCVHKGMFVGAACYHISDIPNQLISELQKLHVGRQWCYQSVSTIDDLQAAV